MRRRTLHKRSYTEVPSDFMFSYEVLDKFVFNHFEDGEVEFPWDTFHAILWSNDSNIEDDITDPDYFVEMWSLRTPGDLATKLKRRLISVSSCSATDQLNGLMEQCIATIT